MTEFSPSTESEAFFDEHSSVRYNIQNVIKWLRSGREAPKQRYFEALEGHLQTVSESDLPTVQSLKLKELIYEHGHRMIDSLLQDLHTKSLPISRKRRGILLAAQSMLSSLAERYIQTLDVELSEDSELDRYSNFASLYRVAYSYSRHLLISYLAAMPAGISIWSLYHQSFLKVRELEAEDFKLYPESPSIGKIYLRSLLLDSFQPASFTSPALQFLSEYIALNDEEINFEQVLPLNQGVFWIHAESDIGAYLLVRRKPRLEDNAFFFSCESIVRRAGEHLQQLSKRQAPSDIGLPEYAGSVAGMGVLRRISGFIEATRKRGFKRQRSDARAQLCAGVDDLWWMLHQLETDPEELSDWLVSNESPDGFSLMHLSGQTKQLHVGDIVTFRMDKTTDWQVCIVRWWLSEGPEHIEMGLQVLSSKAEPAELAVSEQSGAHALKVPVLILPEQPPLRKNCSVVVQSEVAHVDATDMVLITQDTGRILLQDIHLTQQEEQTAYVEIFGFEVLGR